MAVQLQNRPGHVLMHELNTCISEVNALVISVEKHKLCSVVIQ